MEKYILQILEKNSRVIVPDFGAFIVKQKSPLTIVFNEFLQYNDGMLVDAVAKGEGIGRDEAKEKVDAFVKNITASLDKAGKYNIEELGLLVKNSAGKISLDSAEQDTEKEKPKTKAPASVPTTKAEEKKPAKPAEKKVPAKAKTEEIPASKKPIPTVPKLKQTETAGEKDAAKEKPKSIVQAATKRTMVKPTPEKPAVSEKKETKVAEKKVVSSPPPAAEKTTQKTSTTKQSAEYASFEKRVETSSQTEKKKGNKVLLWVIIIVLVNAGIFAFFYFNGYLDGLLGSDEDTEELLVPIVEDEPAIESETAPSMDPMMEEEILESEPVPLAPPEPVQKTTISGRKYYIVAGVFSVENNADKLAEELRGKGYNSQKFGKIGNMHAVSYGVYSSKAEANKALNEIKQNENPQVWIKVVD